MPSVTFPACPAGKKRVTKVFYLFRIRIIQYSPDHCRKMDSPMN